MDRSSKQKINKATVAFNDKVEHMDSTDTFRMFHPRTAEYTFFTSAHGTLARTNKKLSHKSHQIKKKIKVIPCIFSDNMIKQAINPKKKSEKTTNTYSLITYY